MKSTPKTLETLEQPSDGHSNRGNDEQERDGGSPCVTEQTVRLSQPPFGGFRRSAPVKEGNHSWLVRTGLMELVSGMMDLSQAYDFPLEGSLAESFEQS